MISNLVVFGDSWCYGSELDFSENAIKSECATTYRLQHSFPGIIAKHYNLTLHNLAIEGSSLQSTIWEFESWLEKSNLVHNSLLLFGLTFPWRQSWWNNRSRTYEHSIVLNKHQDVQNNFVQLNKIWTSDSLDEWLSKKQYQTAVYIFSGICSQLRIPSIQFDIFEKKFTIPFDSVINSGNSLVQILDGLQKKHPDQKLMYLHHPTELGHNFIAKYLIDHIDKSNLINTL